MANKQTTLIIHLLNTTQHVVYNPIIIKVYIFNY